MKLKYFLIAPLLYGLSACEDDFLERKPLTATLDDLEQGKLEGQVFGMYSSLRSNDYMVLPALTIENFRDDDSEKGSSKSDGADFAVIADNFVYTKDHWFSNSYWTKSYELINRTNKAIATAEKEKSTSDLTKINLAEVRFFRAWAYFNLVRCYGEVPLIDFEIVNLGDGNLPKASLEKLYAFIDKDLAFAAANLPLTWENKFVGRLSKGAANALRARYALWVKDYNLALTSAEAVISSNKHTLLPDYYKVFKYESRNSSESIWEIQTGVFTSGSDTYGFHWGTSQGIRDPGIPSWNLGWGWNTPTQKLIDAYEKGDKRKNATVLVAGQSDDPEYGGYGRTLPYSVFDTTVGPLTRKYWNKKIYVDPALNTKLGFNSFNAPFLNKIILRYADVLLMAAEAANELGDGTKAETYLEMVRARARNKETNLLPKVTFKSKNQMLDAIKYERRVELALEGLRFYDLVRWGDAEIALGSSGYTSRHRFMPLPQPEIDKSNGVLVQNPEWP